MIIRERNRLVLGSLFVLALALSLSMFCVPQAFADEPESKGSSSTDDEGIIYVEGPLPEAWLSDDIMPLDYTDETLDLRLDQDTTWGSQIRWKDTYSSVYARITSMGNFAKLYIDGWEADYSYHKNCTVGGVANLDARGKYEIRNLVRESQLERAQITAWRSSGQATRIGGVWSPDYQYESGVHILNPY